MGGLPLFNVGIRNQRGCHERHSFCPSWESNPGLRDQSPVRYPLGYRFTLVSGYSGRVELVPGIGIHHYVNIAQTCSFIRVTYILAK